MNNSQTSNPRCFLLFITQSVLTGLLSVGGLTMPFKSRIHVIHLSKMRCKFKNNNFCGQIFIVKFSFEQVFFFLTDLFLAINRRLESTFVIYTQPRLNFSRQNNDDCWRKENISSLFSSKLNIAIG